MWERIVGTLQYYSEGKKSGVWIIALIWSCFLFFKMFSFEPLAMSPFYFLNLGIHELGHWLTLGLGTTISVAMGTIAQLAFPLGIGFAMLKSQDLFGALFCLTWLGESLLYCSWYCRSALHSHLVIGKIGLSDMLHDWVYMLGKMGIVHHAGRVADMIWFLGLLSIATFLIAGSFMTYWAIRHPKTDSIPY